MRKGLYARCCFMLIVGLSIILSMQLWNDESQRAHFVEIEDGLTINESGNNAKTGALDSQKTEVESYHMTSDETHVNDVDSQEVDSQDEESHPIDVSEEISDNEIADEAYQFPVNEPGGLDPTHVILNVAEELPDSVNLTFRLNRMVENCSIILLSETNQLITEFEANGNEVTLQYGYDNRVEYIYNAQITGLKPETSYSYCIKQNNLYSDIYDFRTGSNQLTTLGFFGDTQGYKKSQYEDFRYTVSLANTLVEGPILHYIAGDIVDNGHSMDEWGYFYDSLVNDLAENIWVSAIGNHDVKGSYSAYVNGFNYPENGIESLSNRCFYFDIPFGRVAVIDTESPDLFDEQQQWLLTTMESANVDNKIVLMHRSPYPVAYDEAYIRQWDNVFEEVRIDLVLSGHDHIYSRTTIVDDQVVAPGDGVTYVSGGSSSGSKFYSPINIEDRYWVSVVDSEKLPVFTLVEVSRTGITLNAYHVVGQEAELFDTFEILIK